MAARLYLAAENRCDLNYVQLDTPEGGNKNTFLEMENEEAEECLRQKEVSNNCEKGSTRFNDNFKMWITGKEKHMPKLKSPHSLHLVFSVFAVFFAFY